VIDVQPRNWANPLTLEHTFEYVVKWPSDMPENSIQGRPTVALKKSDLYASLWASCDQLRGGMDASQYKDYILTLLFVKYVSDKAKTDPNSLIDVPAGGSFDDMLAAKGDKEIGDRFNKIIAKLAEANEKINIAIRTLADANDLQGSSTTLTSTTPTSSARARRCRTASPSSSPSSTTSTSAAHAPRATTCSATPTST